MKKIYTFLAILISFTFGAASQVQPFGKQTLMINTDVVIDSVGNALFSSSGKLNAVQWQIWNHQYGGGNASMVRRNIETFMSPYYVYDFKYNPDEMNRTFNLQYKAKGTITYLGKDKWEASIGLKNDQPIKIGENVFTVVKSGLGSQGVLQETMKVTLPPDTHDMSFDNDEFGNVTVKYKRPTESVTTIGNNSAKNAAYSLMALGVLSLGGLLAFRKKIK